MSSGTSGESKDAVRLGDICEMYTGRSLRGLQGIDVGGVRLVRGYDLREGDVLSHEGLQQIGSARGLSEKSRLRMGDILIPSITRKPRAVLVARDMGECYAHPSVTIVRPKSGAPPSSVLADYLRSPAFLEVAGRCATQLRDHLRLSPSALSALPIPTRLADAEFLGGLIERPFGTVAVLNLVSPELLRALRREPNLLEQLGWRQFEGLLAEVLARLGYEVELQRGTKDGGVDIFAVKRVDPFGPHRYLLQAKRTKNSVGIRPVRELIFLHQHHRVTRSCLATTSVFTRGAWRLAEEYSWQLELKDSAKLREWIDAAVRLQ